VQNIDASSLVPEQDRHREKFSKILASRLAKRTVINIKRPVPTRSFFSSLCALGIGGCDFLTDPATDRESLFHLLQCSLENQNRSGRRASVAVGSDHNPDNDNRDLSLDLQEHIENEARDDGKYEAMVNLEYANRCERGFWGGFWGAGESPVKLRTLQ